MSPPRARFTAVVGFALILVVQLILAIPLANSDNGSAPRPLTGDGPTFEATIAKADTSNLGRSLGASPSHPAEIRHSSNTTFVSPNGPVALCDDPSSGFVLAVSANTTGVGNATSFGSELRTWSYSAGIWTELHPPRAPPNRWGAALTYDPLDLSVILFGGVSIENGTLSFFNDTWSFGNGTWTNLTGSTLGSPGPRAYSTFSWDAAKNFGLLFGGYDGVNLTDSWALTSSGWMLVAVAGAGPHLSGGAMASDPADGSVVYFGGQNTNTAQLSSDTWVFTGGRWTNETGSLSGSPGGRWNPALAPNPTANGLVLFGGASRSAQWVDHNDTWLLANNSWTKVNTTASIPPRQAPNLVYDSTDNGLLLFGGFNQTIRFDDSWLFNLTWGWAQTDPVLSLSRPLTDIGVGVAFIARSTFQPGPVNYTYPNLPGPCMEYSPTSFHCSPTSPGSYAITVVASSGGESAVATQSFTVAPLPAITAFSATRAILDLGQATNLSVSASGGVGPLTYLYSGLPAGCAVANSAILPCAPWEANVTNVTVNLTDSLGLFALASLRLVVNPALTIGSILVGSTTPVVGAPVSMSIEVRGGTAPYAYAFDGLPAGCSGTNESALVCIPSRSGDYSVRVTVVDGVSASVNGSFQLDVGPAATAAPSANFLDRIGPWDSFALGLAVASIPLAALGIGLVRSYRREKEAVRLRERLVRLSRGTGHPYERECDLSPPRTALGSERGDAAGPVQEPK